MKEGMTHGELPLLLRRSGDGDDASLGCKRRDVDGKVLKSGFRDHLDSASHRVRIEVSLGGRAADEPRQVGRVDLRSGSKDEEWCDRYDRLVESARCPRAPEWARERNTSSS